MRAACALGSTAGGRGQAAGRESPSSVLAHCVYKCCMILILLLYTTYYNYYMLMFISASCLWVRISKTEPIMKVVVII